MQKLASRIDIHIYFASLLEVLGKPRVESKHAIRIIVLFDQLIDHQLFIKELSCFPPSNLTFENVFPVIENPGEKATLVGFIRKLCLLLRKRAGIWFTKEAYHPNSDLLSLLAHSVVIFSDYDKVQYDYYSFLDIWECAIDVNEIRRKFEVVCIKRNRESQAIMSRMIGFLSLFEFLVASLEN